MVDVAQLVRVPDCGSEGRGFEPHLPPKKRCKTVLTKLVENLKNHFKRAKTETDKRNNLIISAYE